MNQEKRPITLEDLLRLKRAERPPAEFWNQFERELRAKQLAALVARRPWWRSLPQAFSGFRRYHLPLGATAILALTFIATREFRHATPAVVAPAVVSNAPVAENHIAAAAPVDSLFVDDSAATAEIAGAPTAPLALSSPEENPAEPSRTAAVFGESLTPDPASPSARTIAANLAAAQAAAPSITRGLLTSARGFETRSLPVRSGAIEPLAQMTSPADMRQAKFASALATSYSRGAPSRYDDRGPRNVPDERLYDGAVRRFDAKADRLTLKL